MYDVNNVHRRFRPGKYSSHWIGTSTGGGERLVDAHPIWILASGSSVMLRSVSAVAHVFLCQ